MKQPLRWTFAYTTVEPGRIVDHVLRIRVSGWLPFAFVRHTKVQRAETLQAAPGPDAVNTARNLELDRITGLDPWWAHEEQALRDLAVRPPTERKP